jgi:hypothetical protein
MTWFESWMILLSLAAGIYANETADVGTNLTENLSTRNGKSNFFLYLILRKTYHQIILLDLNFSILFFSIFTLLHCSVQKHRMQKSKFYDNWTKVNV